MPIIHDIGALLTYMDVVDDCIQMYCPSCLLSVVLETSRVSFLPALFSLGIIYRHQRLIGGTVKQVPLEYVHVLVRIKQGSIIKRRSMKVKCDMF